MTHREHTMDAWRSYQSAEDDQRTVVQNHKSTLSRKVTVQTIGAVVAGALGMALLGTGITTQPGNELGLLLSTLSLVGAGSCLVAALLLTVAQSENRRKIRGQHDNIPQQRLRALMDTVAEYLRSSGYTVATIDYDHKIITTSAGNVTLGQENGDLLLLLNGKRLVHSYGVETEKVTDIDGKPIIIQGGIGGTL